MPAIHPALSRQKGVRAVRACALAVRVFSLPCTCAHVHTVHSMLLSAVLNQSCLLRKAVCYTGSCMATKGWSQYYAPLPGRLCVRVAEGLDVYGYLSLSNPNLAICPAVALGLWLWFKGSGIRV